MNLSDEIRADWWIKRWARFVSASFAINRPGPLFVFELGAWSASRSWAVCKDDVIMSPLNNQLVILTFEPGAAHISRT